MRGATERRHRDALALEGRRVRHVLRRDELVRKDDGVDGETDDRDVRGLRRDERGRAAEADVELARLEGLHDLAVTFEDGRLDVEPVLLIDAGHLRQLGGELAGLGDAETHLDVRLLGSRQRDCAGRRRLAARRGARLGTRSRARGGGRSARTATGGDQHRGGEDAESARELHDRMVLLLRAPGPLAVGTRRVGM